MVVQARPSSQHNNGRYVMSRTRLIFSILAAMVLAIGTAACSVGGDEEATKTVTVSDTTTGGTSSGKTVKIIASVPPTDHGWLGAISKDAKAAADQHDDVDFELLQAADADSQAQQIEQAIAQKPDVLVVLPQDGAALTPVAQKAEAAGIPVVNIDRLFTAPDAATATVLGDNYQIGVLASPSPPTGPRASPTPSRRSAPAVASRSSPRSRAISTLTRV